MTLCVRDNEVIRNRVGASPVPVEVLLGSSVDNMPVIPVLRNYVLGAKPLVPALLQVPARTLYFGTSTRKPEIQEELERRFFTSIRLKNGTFKTTYANRLNDLNRALLQYLPSHRPLRLMDVAVSSGISTLEWIGTLNDAGVEHHMVAGDLSVNAFLLSLGNHLHVLTDGNGYPLQFDVFGRTAPNPPGKLFSGFFLLPLTLIRTAIALEFSRLRDARRAASPTGLIHEHGLRLRPILLVSPRLLRAAKLDVVEDDILNDAGRYRDFDVVRASNILNTKYFSPEVLTTMIGNLRSRLKAGGLLVICRTDSQNVNNGTIFKVNRSGGFDVIARIGCGSEVENIALALKSAQPSS